MKNKPHKILSVISIISIFFLLLSIKVFSQSPTGYYPSWDQLIIDTTLTIKWNTVDGATLYNAQISDDISFNNLIIDEINIQTDTLSISGLSKNKTYYWRISANTGSGNWGAVNKFKCFIPSGIPTLSLWLKADTGITLSGQNVIQWDDQSGNNNHVSQSNQSLCPILNSNSINNKNSVSFDGVNNYLSGAPINDINISSISLFILAKGNSQASGSNNAKSFFSIGTSSNGHWISRNRYNSRLMIYNKGAYLIFNIKYKSSQ